jgi:hypothetical protein
MSRDEQNWRETIPWLVSKLNFGAHQMNIVDVDLKEMSIAFSYGQRIEAGAGHQITYFPGTMRTDHLALHQCM